MNENLRIQNDEDSLFRKPLFPSTKRRTKKFRIKGTNSFSTPKSNSENDLFAFHNAENIHPNRVAPPLREMIVRKDSETLAWRRNSYCVAKNPNNNFGSVSADFTNLASILHNPNKNEFGSDTEDTMDIENENLQQFNQKSPSSGYLNSFERPQTTRPRNYSDITTPIRFSNLVSPPKSLEQDECLLPVLLDSSHPNCNCIGPETVRNLFNGAYNHLYNQVMFIDCRFPYEYNGGHVTTALNLTVEKIREMFINSPKYHNLGKQICIIFYCEFSSHRGPKGYKFLRDLDRSCNEHCYPNLYYPEIYLLQGGYKQFFNSTQSANLVEPNGYIEMRDSRFSEEMKYHMNKTKKRSLSRRRFLSRSCSDIFSDASFRKNLF
eukprot:TRINITY_DN11878_c0_g1_i1.p1 TRINITY_DN11878_c0_g1~~TRINITY_DN11878_c0_g1_i1.p1  ORF type:complete len:378 (+),score=61.08 TRINITY_DN11878_c0_g1_i1:153-1286(+)